MKKLAVIGAGSHGFTRGLMRDILSVEALHDMEIAFTDINERNLEITRALCQKDIDANGVGIRISATTDRREAFKDADYIINVVRIGGLEAFKKDVEVPLRYGVDQCVGDTLCAGGIFYGQRGIYIMLGICEDIREAAKKEVLLLNYANPNVMITWACNKYGGVKTIGLCHGVQHGQNQIANALGLKYEDIDIVCAGINHQTWYVSVKHNGVELKDTLYEKMRENTYFREEEKCRLDVMRNFGYYSTESNGHLSEYLMWYRKTPEDINKWRSNFDWSGGETGGYLRHCCEQRDNLEKNWQNYGAMKYGADKRSSEHASYILEALETGKRYRGHVNYLNGNCITNLPADCIIEAPCIFTKDGFDYESVGELPVGCAAICSQSIFVQRLGVEAAVKGDYALLKQAMLMDPLTGAKLNSDAIEQLTDEMLIEEQGWLPQYAAEIPLAQFRLKECIDNGNYFGGENIEAFVKKINDKPLGFKRKLRKSLKRLKSRLIARLSKNLSS